MGARRYILREEDGAQTSQTPVASLYLEPTSTADGATDDHICAGQVRLAGLVCGHKSHS